MSQKSIKSNKPELDQNLKKNPS